MHRRQRATQPESEAPAEAPKVVAPSPTLTGGNQMVVRLLRSGESEAAPQQDIAGRISGQLGRGQALPGNVQADMESGLGHSFGDVVVHRDAESATLADQLGARAFTTGRDIFFGQGAYAPDTAAGRETIAHELTHTVQQQSGPVAGTKVADNLVVSDPGDRDEREASSVASAMRGGGPVAIEEHATSHLHRDKKTDDRLSNLETQEAVLAKRVAALELDNQWRPKFGEKLASYEQVIHRITHAFNAATNGFVTANQQQQQADALAVQVIGLLATVGVAGSFEWVFTKALGRLGMSASKIESVIETIENPANAAASGTVNVVAAVKGATDNNQRQAPPTDVDNSSEPMDNPVAYLTARLEKLAAHKQKIEAAFLARATTLKGLTPEQWQTQNIGAQEKVYQERFDALNKDAQGIESLLDEASLAKVIERHMWATWIRNQDASAREAARKANEDGAATGSGPVDLDPNSPRPRYELGSHVEDRLNAVEAAKAAAVTLTGHWYSSNSPDNWFEKLFAWASNYKEGISTK